MADTPEAFLLDDYKQKISYLTNHLQRMWTRFNFFVTLEAALLGGKVLLVPDKPSPMVGIAGMILSIVWYVMGAQDRFLADFYRWQIKEAAGRVKLVISESDKTDGNGSKADRAQAARQVELARNAATEYVGTVEDKVIEKYKHWKKRKLLERMSSWRSEQFSPTHLAAWIPLIAILLWLLYSLIVHLQIKIPIFDC